MLSAIRSTCCDGDSYNWCQPMKLKPTHIQTARRHLRAADPVMRSIIDAVGRYTLRYRLEDLPDKQTSLRIAAAWRPYASVASWYCWRSLDLARNTETVATGYPL